MNDESVVLTGTGVTPVEFLEAVYMNPDLPLTVRIKAAVEALPYVHPKLAMVATANANGDFGAMLERAIAASNAVRKPKLIEAKPEPNVNGHHEPTPQEVSSARMGKSFAPLRRRA
jgi:hypothetical protein